MADYNMHNDNPNPGDRSEGESPKKDTKGSAGSASRNEDPRAPWRLAVAAAEANADALLGYREEVQKLEKALADAVVPSAEMAALKERVLMLEQSERNASVTISPTAPAELPRHVWSLLCLMLIVLAAVCGVLAGHLKAERAVQPTIHHGGIRP